MSESTTKPILLWDQSRLLAMQTCVTEAKLIGLHYRCKELIALLELREQTIASEIVLRDSKRALTAYEAALGAWDNGEHKALTNLTS